MFQTSHDRLKVIKKHVVGNKLLIFNETSASTSQDSEYPQNIISVVPRKRTDLVKWNGWGYKDSMFRLNERKQFEFIGNRYPICEGELPYVKDWVMSRLPVDFDNPTIPKPEPTEFPPPNVPQELLHRLKEAGIPYSIEGMERLVHSHGQTSYDIYYLRCLGRPGRLPDIVTWPGSHEEVQRVVELADELNIVVIPYGGGTNVSDSVNCPEEEQRPIMALDTTRMNRLLWLKPDNLTACFEAGIIGQDLERELQARGYTCGHEPDSYEFSSLGGWVATRASGMKKNIYGNIEDLLVHAKMVTPRGVLEKPCLGPRVSSGPDFNHLILGSEGTLGVVTEVVIKIRPLPPCKKYGSVLFPDFESGLEFMREVAKKRCQPASVRLMDNDQFQLGQILKHKLSFFEWLKQSVNKAYVLNLKGYQVEQVCLVTMLFEGEPEEVAMQEKKIYKIVSSANCVIMGEANGERGYILTFVIAYIRDIMLELNIIGESFETSVPWDSTLMLCRNVKYRIASECERLGIKHFLISCRVTQVYDTGCCVYFYFVFNWTGFDDPVNTHKRIEEQARDEIIACGGSISHHHGIGKLRTKWYPSQVSPIGASIYDTLKSQIDPNNIFANGNLHSPL